MKLILACLLAASGCGGQPSVPQDELDIQSVIAHIADARTSSEELTELFTDDALPDQDWLQATKERSFVVESTQVTGDSAEVVIAVEDYLGDVHGTETWVLRRAGGRWKIAAAPLP